MSATRPKTRIPWPRVIGGTLIGAGILGMLISLAGLIFVAVASATAEAALMRELSTLDQALAATSDGLSIADSTLGETSSALESLSITLSSATRAITETQPALGALEDLTGSSLPGTIGATREALASAQETARLIDNVLGSVPFIGLAYNPEIPLNVAIGGVSDSLAELPASLEEVAAGIGTSSENLTTIASDLGEVTAGLEAIAASVGEATTVIDQYQAIVSDLRAEVAAVREAAPGWINAVRIGLMLLMLWLALAQIGLLSQGWELWSAPAQPKEG